MQVIGVGFGRTGTVSLRLALEALGFAPCYHMKELYDRPERLALWRAAAEGRADWTQVLAGYRATLGWPGCAFWPGLVAAFPEAKVILTSRDPAEWYRSAYRTLYRSRFGPDGAPRTPEGRAGEVFAFNEEVIWQGAFGGRFEQPEHAVRVFTEHERRVRAGVPAERLLEFRAADGWAPLCAFLGVPVPDRPYPDTNSAESYRARVLGPGR
ncbi:sulfotransferase family protein [Allonocardiopsis opalescens]|uniref:Sulfotransferase family protein n=1 Tax=Allonocardiopsis opalescens TaxID=1144618 RepID=A0A2T0QEV1_9ACTN|nr:sulfotransferase family protein [Allonocardiopsis opalescens]PRY02466.1 hypothetical protein CLV72_1011068 [Allonocardiopsis opalescens]